MIDPDPGRDPLVTPHRSVPPERPAHKVPPPHGPEHRPGPEGEDRTFLPSRLFDRPTSVFIYGPSRPLVNLTLYALAAHTNPQFQWVEIGSSSGEREPCDPVRLGWVAEDRLWIVDAPEGLLENDKHANLPVGSMIHGDESPADLRRFIEFLKLPDRSQKILADLPSDGAPGVVAVCDIQRASRVFPAKLVPAILDVHRAAGCSVFVGHHDSINPGRGIFDFVFRIQGEDRFLSDWKENELVCEKGITSGPLRNYRPVRLEEVPLLAKVLARARPTP